MSQIPSSTLSTTHCLKTNNVQNINSRVKSYFSPIFFRKKHEKIDTNLKQCLTTTDLISLGIGAVLGAGVYVVAGQVASLIAGPSVVISFLISAFASLLSGLAYAEFGARVPNTTGGAYAYSYVAVGEIWAFFIGWNLILEYMIGTAADASALSASLEHLVDAAFGNATYYFSPFDPIIGETRPDLVAFTVTLAVTWLLALGCKDSTRFGTFCNVINVAAILFLVVVGAFYADPTRWSTYDKFFPYGIGGTFAGAASCFYAFVGFDIIATTGEESANPSKSIPKAIVFTLLFVVVCYIGVSTVITMLTDYSNLGERSPLVTAFQMAGITWASHVISVGAVFGVASSLLGSMFPLPRIIYAMSCDNLIHPVFSKVNKFTNVPILATAIPGILTAIFALIFDLKELVEMMSIGTLLAYSLVSLCVMVLRYQPTTFSTRDNNSGCNSQKSLTDLSSPEASSNISKQSVKDTRDYDNTRNQPNNLLQQICYNLKRFTCEKLKRSCDATHHSFKTAMICVFICVSSSTTCSLVSIISFDSSGCLAVWATVIIIVFGILFGFFYVLLLCQPQNNDEVAFKAPFVPTLSLVAIIINIFLMMKLSTATWVRFCVWMVLGIIIYFGYGIRNSQFFTDE